MNSTTGTYHIPSSSLDFYKGSQTEMRYLICHHQAGLRRSGAIKILKVVSVQPMVEVNLYHQIAGTLRAGVTPAAARGWAPVGSLFRFDLIPTLIQQLGALLPWVLLIFGKLPVGHFIFAG